MIVRSGPFSELEKCLSLRNLKSFFKLEKCLSVRNLKSLSELERNRPSWTIFQNLKMIVLNSMICQCSLPTLRVISSLLAKGVISMIPNLSQKYENFILDKGFVRISAICSSVGIYWSFTSPSWNLSRIK
jgi:hypothetical protein